MNFADRIRRTPIPHEPERGRPALLLPAGPTRDLAFAAAAGSPHLAGILEREGEWAAAALAGPPEDARDAILAEIGGERGDRAGSLRRAKRRMALLVALADLGGVWTLEEVTAALSELADRAVRAALAAALERERARGRLPEDDGAVVLAMGKLGAGELNYSSDIDLICLFDRSRHAPSDYMEIRAALVRAVRAMTRTLSEPRADGFVFRVDLRLRPDPSVTPVILPMDAAERYYESLARTWERAAYVKARACAGDLAAGRAFLDGLRPFVWRRHLDFAAVEDVHAMVRRIRDHRGDHGAIQAPGHDLKLGPGGIRAIEFIAQAHQLLFGGRDERLRVRGTLDALARLAEAGHLPGDAAAELSQDYCALREAEHRLQMVRDAQTQTMPTAPDELDRQARLHGEAHTPAFLARLTARLERVERWSARTIGPAQRTGPRPPVDVPERWASYPALRSARARDGFERIAGPLMERIGRAPRPEEALAVLDRFLAGLPAGAQLFALFEANPPLMDLVVDIASSAPGLARHLSRNAGVLDAVIAGGFFASWPREGALTDELAAAMAREADHEARLDAARRWANEWRFRVGVHHLRGLICGDTAGAQYAEVAGAVLRALLPVVEADLALRHGAAPGRGAVVVGMGSLGAGWLHAGSDLDVILLYDAHGSAESAGRRPLPARTWYARLAQSLVTALTAPMAQGRLYEVDMRLRPSGRQGPVATSIEAFREYQRDEAWTWERLALTRARPVAGGDAMAGRVEALRAEALARPIPPGTLARDVRDMRDRLARARPMAGAWDVRSGPGGMRDVELFGQARALREGFAARATPDQLGEPGSLRRTYELQRRVRAAEALLAPDGFSPEAVGQGGTAMLLRETGLDDTDALRDRLAEVRECAAAEIDAGLAAMARDG